MDVYGHHSPRVQTLTTVPGPLSHFLGPALCSLLMRLDLRRRDPGAGLEMSLGQGLLGVPGTWKGGYGLQVGMFLWSGDSLPCGEGLSQRRVGETPLA